MKLTGTLLRVEPNGFGVVQLDDTTSATGIFTGSDRAPTSKPSSFRPQARIVADAGEQHGHVQYLSNVEISS